jgi:hypothetical protein
VKIINGSATAAPAGTGSAKWNKEQ